MSLSCVFAYCVRGNKKVRSEQKKSKRHTEHSLLRHLNKNNAITNEKSANTMPEQRTIDKCNEPSSLATVPPF